jgi:hypothetical protein
MVAESREQQKPHRAQHKDEGQPSEKGDIVSGLAVTRPESLANIS